MTDESSTGIGTGVVVGILVVVVVLVALVVLGVGGLTRESGVPSSVPNGQTAAPSMKETDESTGGDGGNAMQEVTLPDTNIDIPEEIDINVNQPEE